MLHAFAIAAHPDDIEFWMSGTLMLLKRAGYEIHYMNVANGCCGSTQWNATETKNCRHREAMRAAEMIGAHFYPSLVNDLEVFYDDCTLKRLAAVIREVNPQIILTHSPVDYMEDHTNTCRLAVTAAFARGMPNYPTNPSRSPVETAVAIYHAQPHGNCDPLGRIIEPSIFVDVTSVMREKMHMLGCHESQRAWLDESQGMDSYVDSMRQLLRDVGRMSGRFEFAEGWRKHQHYGFCSVTHNRLADVLSPFIHQR